MNKFIILILTISISFSVQAGTKSNIVVSPVGFFNSKSPDFSPRRIGYSAMVNFKAWHKALSKKLSKDGKVVSYGFIDKQFKKISPEEEEKLSKLILISLQYTNDYLLKQKSSCENCSELKFLPIKRWGENDKVYVFIGLETLTKSGGLRSGLTMIEFDGRGNFKRIATTPYNFTNYNTIEMVLDSEKLIKSL